MPVKINNFKIIAVMLVLFASAFFCPQLTNAYPSASETYVDFSEVYIGSTGTRILHITNLDRSNGISIELGFDGGFSGFSVGTPSVYMEPGQTVDVYLYFAPVYPGACSDTLYIQGGSERVEVEVYGTGIEIPVSTAVGVIIDDVLTFFDQAVEAGSLTGLGQGKSAGNRLNALRNMIETAGYLIENEHLGEACGQLRAITKKIEIENGLNFPKGSSAFVGGEAAVELADLIQQVMENIGCL